MALLPFSSTSHLLALLFLFLLLRCSTAANGKVTLSSTRDSLAKQEDTILFGAIERAKNKRNSPVYGGHGGTRSSPLEVFVGESEVANAKVGRYENPEEIPFFPYKLPVPLHIQQPLFLHPAAAQVNISKLIWETYIEKLLPMLTSKGDDGDHAYTVSSDLLCLQALSRRIHYGRFVAEAKFRIAPEKYTAAIQSQDRNELNELLTDRGAEEKVKSRVERKAMIFSQILNISGKTNNAGGTINLKVDPSLLSSIYEDWIIPLTKLVQVEYLLHRLD